MNAVTNSLPEPAKLFDPGGENALVREQLEDQFHEHQGALLGTIYHVVGNREDACDVLQETFLKCWRHREQVSQVKNLRAWMFRIAINTAKDARKSAWKRRKRPLEATFEPHCSSLAGASMIEQEQNQCLQRAIGDLREQDREIFLLRQNGQMTYEEIAQTLSLPPGTVKTRMRMALTKLRQAIGGDS